MTDLLVDSILEYVDTTELNLLDECKAIAARTVHEAQCAIEVNPPALAILDVRLSETDVSNSEGIVLLEWIKANYPPVPVIAISAYPEFGAESLALGAGCFLREPVQPQVSRVRGSLK